MGHGFGKVQPPDFPLTYFGTVLVNVLTIFEEERLMCLLVFVAE